MANVRRDVRLPRRYPVAMINYFFARQFSFFLIEYVALQIDFQHLHWSNHHVDSMDSGGGGLGWPRTSRPRVNSAIDVAGFLSQVKTSPANRMLLLFFTFTKKKKDENVLKNIFYLCRDRLFSAHLSSVLKSACACVFYRTSGLGSSRDNLMKSGNSRFSARLSEREKKRDPTRVAH